MYRQIIYTLKNKSPIDNLNPNIKMFTLLYKLINQIKTKTYKI